MRRDSSWLFEEWPENTMLRSLQVLATSITRVIAIALMPIRQILRRLTTTA